MAQFSSFPPSQWEGAGFRGRTTGRSFCPERHHETGRINLIDGFAAADAASGVESPSRREWVHSHALSVGTLLEGGSVRARFAASREPRTRPLRGVAFPQVGGFRQRGSGTEV